MDEIAFVENERQGKAEEGRGRKCGKKEKQRCSKKGGRKKVQSNMVLTNTLLTKICL